MKAEQEYKILLESGDLLAMYPGFSGEWEKDRKIFTQIYEDNQRIINGFE